MKTPDYSQRLFNALVRPAIQENNDIGGSEPSKKRGLGFQSYATNHISPQAAREEKETSGKSSDEKKTSDDEESSKEKKSSNKKSKSRFIDPELERQLGYATQHYSVYDDNEQMAFNKYLDRSITNIKKINKTQDQEIRDLRDVVNSLRAKIKPTELGIDNTAPAPFPVYQKNLDESTSLVTTIRSIVANGEIIANVYEQLKHAAQKYVDNHGELDGFNMVAGGIGHQWFQTFYFNKLQKELFDLSKQINNRDAAHLVDFLKGSGRDEPKSFSRISKNLPEILFNIGRKIKNADLESFGRNWESRKNNYNAYLDKLAAESGQDPIQDMPKVKNPSANAAIGQQNTQVEKIVNDVLNKLPSRVAGDVRNAIARSPNKLQALMQELQKRNINVSEERMSDSMLPKGAFAGYPKNKLGPEAQLKGSMKRSAKPGDLVGEAPVVNKPLKTARHQAKNKIKAAYFDKVSENSKLVPVNESIEKLMDQFINQIIYNETVSNNKR